MRYRELRYPCDTDLLILLDGSRRQARLVNLGHTGARVEGLGTIPRGSAVTISHIGALYPATVIWSNPQRAGLRFWQRLTAAQVSALRQVSAHDGKGWLAPAAGGFREMA